MAFLREILKHKARACQAQLPENQSTAQGNFIDLPSEVANLPSIIASTSPPVSTGLPTQDLLIYPNLICIQSVVSSIQTKYGYFCEIKYRLSLLYGLNMDLKHETRIYALQRLSFIPRLFNVDKKNCNKSILTSLLLGQDFTSVDQNAT